MEYLLKLNVRKEELEMEIRAALKEGYQLKTEVTRAPGQIRIPGLDVTVFGFNVRDLQTGNCASYIAVGYEDAGTAKYRIHGFLEPYCPKCNVSHTFTQAGKYCSKCGTMVKYRI